MKQSAPDGTVFDVAPTCDYVLRWDDQNTVELCGATTAYWYPANGGGTASLCEAHGTHLAAHCYRYEPAPITQEAEQA